MKVITKSPIDKKHCRVRAFAIAERTPPEAAQLWDVGDNPTDYGVHVWSERSAREVLARYNERGNPLLVDIEHNGALLESQEPALVAGYAHLEIREGAPWLLFEWSKVGAEQIATGQRRYLSGEYDVDRETQEITKLYRVSLVADPGTYRARVLASALSRSAKEMRMDPTVAAIMGILNSVTDPAAAIEAIKGFVANIEPEAAEEPASDSGEPAFAGAPGAPPRTTIAAAAIPAPAPGQPGAPAPGQSPEPIPGSPPGTAPGPGTPQPAPQPPPPAQPNAGDTTVRAAAALAVQHIEATHRDLLLQTHGDRLDPSIRRWASSQPLNVVRGLIDAAPAAQAPTARVQATRGAGQGSAPEPRGLQGQELEDLQKGMGTFKASSPSTPHMNAKGEFVLPTITPSEHRRIQAAAAAAPKAGT